jgi:8-oxo-dGTP diphosphatase
VPTPPYILELRRALGHAPLLLPGVCGVVVREDLVPGRRHVLLVRRTDTGAWSLPAGIVEPGEQPATTLVRELIEETRVTARVERLVWLVADPELTYPNGDRCQFLTMVFRCSYLSGEAAVGDEESTEVRWAPVDDLPDLDARSRERLAHGLSDAERCAFDLTWTT